MQNYNPKCCFINANSLSKSETLVFKSSFSWISFREADHKTGKSTPVPICKYLSPVSSSSSGLIKSPSYDTAFGKYS